MDFKFLQTATVNAILEQQLGRLAVERGSRDQVKRLGQTIVDSKTEFISDLTYIASMVGIMLPKEPSIKDQAIIAKLSALSGEKFDREFIKLMQSSLQKDTTLFRKQIDQSGQTDLKNLAYKTLPTIQAQLQMIRKIANGAKGKF